MITNNPTITNDAMVNNVRAAIEHRATWFELLIEAAMEKGLEIDFAKSAIFKCGCFHGNNKFPQTSSLKEFTDAFADELGKKVFEMKTTMNPEETEFKIEFGYCPLVAAWKKQTNDEEFIAKLCDIAMDGDRGIISTYPEFQFELGKTIAQGHSCCEVCIRKVK